VDEAFYWLQEAAAKDGVQTAWAERDSDLSSLRRDPRWPEVRTYLQKSQEYWATAAKPVTLIHLPENYDGQKPLPTLIWLHGTFTSPNFTEGSASDLPLAAKRMGWAIIAVSGTIPFGPAKFSWSEDPDRDYRRVVDAIKEVSGRFKPQNDMIIPIGFSQGGQVAIEIAARHPETFAGAIAFAPATSAGIQLTKVKPDPELKKRGFFIECGALDSRLRNAKANIAWLRSTGAQVATKQYASLGHTPPADLGSQLPEWVNLVANVK